MPSNTKSPVQVFWGTDEIESLARLQSWRTLFSERQDGASIFSLDAEGPASELRAGLHDALGTISLFTTVKLVVIKHFLAVKDDVTEKLLLETIAQARSGELVVLLWQRGAPDRRRTIVKKLEAQAKEGKVGINEFKAPDKPAERQAWLSRYWQQQGTAVDQAAVRLVEQSTAGKQFGILRQLAEVIQIAGAPRIDEALVRQYLPDRERPEDFGITAALQRHDRAAALAQLAPLTFSHEDVTAEAIQNFGALIWVIESGWKLREALDRGASPTHVASVAGVNPYVATKLMNIVRSNDGPQWAGWYRTAADLEWAAKHGRTDFATACEQLIWEMTV